MLAQRDGNALRVGLTSLEQEYVNNSLAWLCYGAHELKEDAFEERLGAPRSVFLGP